MKSLLNFPKSDGFDTDSYGRDVRTQVAVESPFDGDVGLELELEGRALPQRVAIPAISGVSWTYHADGSLRAVGGNGPGGAEYVLNQPCKTADVKPLLDGLFGYLEASGTRIQNSTRCSTHVHLNMKGVKLNQLASFVILWGTFEDVLANYCGGHRSGNHFALRLSDCNQAMTAWENAFRTGSFQFSRERRYLALNPACLGTFGSLEVRTMAGATNAAEVVEWVEMLTALKTKALSAEFENPSAIAGAFSGSGSREFAVSIFGEGVVAKLQAACEELDESFDTLVLEGFRRVQSLAYVLPWDRVLPAIKRPFVPNPFGKASPKRKTAFVDIEARAEMPRFEDAPPPPLRLRVPR